MEINIDKSNWSKVNFGDVAIQMKGTVDRDNTDLKYYVKGEHMNSEDVHIRAFGELTDEYLGPAFIRHFKDGDILYGSRRTYLKKVAVAHFEGITSNTTFVINAKENVIDKRLLPFLMLSDEFTEHSIMHSKGSVNPYINWKDLANYEFLLPPKEQQAELADLLWAMDELIEKDLVVALKHQNYFKKNINELTSSSNSYCKNEYLLCQLGDTYNGLSGKSKDDFGVGERFITYMNVYRNFEIDETIFDLVNILPGERQNKVQYGDIIFTGSSETPDEVGITSVVLKEMEDFYLNSFCFGFRLHDFGKLNPRYAKFLFRNSEIRHFLNLRAQGSTRFNLSKTDLKKNLKLGLPKVSKQVEIAKRLDELEKATGLLRDKLQSSRTLHNALINQIF